MKILPRLLIRAAVGTVVTVAHGLGDAAPLHDPVGTFVTEDGRARVRIERCLSMPERLCGYVVWVAQEVDGTGEPFRDRLNPDAGRRRRPLLGHQIMLGLTPTSGSKFTGDIYNAEDGRTYGVTVWPEKGNRISVRGCLLLMLCTTQSWLRTEDVRPGQLVGATGDPTGPTPDPTWAARPTPPPAKRASKSTP